VTARYPRGLGDTNILTYLERLAVDQLPAECLISTVSLAKLSAGVHSAVDAGDRARRVSRLSIRIQASLQTLRSCSLHGNARGPPGTRAMESTGHRG
jgi:hypothetical protein